MDLLVKRRRKNEEKREPRTAWNQCGVKSSLNKIVNRSFRRIGDIIMIEIWC
uniref:Uncharacterized protein n=1 Tax=Anopheles quadriannulatus TaxID=34691 RepID=A0A182XRZ1_ANOQN